MDGRVFARQLELPYSECFTVQADHPSFRGHFPGQPVLPGVVLLDRVARALRRAAGAEAQVAGIRLAKFHLPVLPGDNLRLELLAKGEGTIQFRIVRGEAVVADGLFNVKV
jgi:3-hydroxymyristoyl/3-hydroxydecanoyl-(acyl carrier protein) dehydratase